MTITNAILQKIWENNHSSGEDFIEMESLKSILKEHDPKGFESFKPDLAKVLG